MTRDYSTSNRHMIVQMASNRRGTSAADVAARFSETVNPIKYACSELYALKCDGRLFRSAPVRGVPARWFASEADRDEYDRTEGPAAGRVVAEERKRIKEAGRRRVLDRRNAAAKKRRAEKPKAVKPASTAANQAPVVIPDRTPKDGAPIDYSRAKITRRPAVYDTRYLCAPGERPFGAGFSAVGIGRDVGTGRAWE